MVSAFSNRSFRPGALLLAGLALTGAAFAETGFLSPGRGELLPAGATVEVRWSAPCRDRGQESEGELVMSVDGGITFPIRLTPEMSLCAAGFRWRVPALRTAHARLALRTGSGETSGDERLVMVTEEFAIASAFDGADAELLPGARESWTGQALAGEGTEDLPLESMAGNPEEIIAPSASTDISEPTPSGVTDPGSSAKPFSNQIQPARSAPVRRNSSGSSAPLPLRL